MRIFRRLAQRRRGDGGDGDDGGDGGTDDGAYVCTLCGAAFAERSVVVCPECRGFVVARDER